MVAGSFQSHTGHIDGKPNDARFNHPRGVTVDDKGNVYVADTLNLAIRKIGDAGSRLIPFDLIRNTLTHYISIFVHDRTHET